MHYNGTEIDTNIQYQYLHAHDKMMDVTQINTVHSYIKLVQYKILRDIICLYTI